MKVIGQNTIGQHPHGDALTRKPNQFNKRLIVALFVKHLLASVTTIDHVVAKFSNRCACGSWHATTLPNRILFSKEK